MTTTSNWLVWALSSAVFAALASIFAKIGLKGIDSDFATLVPTFLIIMVLASFVSLTRKWSNPFTLSPKTLVFLALSGLAASTSWICSFRALKIGDASKVVPVDKLSVVLIAIFAFIFLGERPSIREWTGILMIGAGIIVLAFKR